MTTYLVDSSVQTVDDILNNIIASCRLPVSQITFTPSNMLAFLNDEQQITVSNIIRKIREDFWVTVYDQQILQGVYNYDMPSRAMGGVVRDIVFMDVSGNEINCPHLSPEDIKSPNFFIVRPTWMGQGFYLQDNQVILWPQNSTNTAYTLRQRYERRPNSLTLSSNCMQITGVNVSANQLTFVGSPPFEAGESLDVISILGQHPSQGDNFLISSVVGAVVTLDSSTPLTSGVTVGSWACPAGLTCIPQLPDEGYALLMARGMLRIATGLQSTNLFNVASKLAEDSADKLTAILTPRVNGNPKKLVNRNRVGGLYSYPYFR